MLRLYTLPGAWGMPSISPFCTKLETWLRMTGLAFEARFLSFPVRSPAHDFVSAHPQLRAYHARIRERWYAQGPALPQLRW